MTDEEIMAELQEENQEHFDELYDRWAGRVFKTVGSWFSKERDREELSQEAWLNLFRYKYQYNPQRSKFSTWFYRVIYSTCTSRIKPKKNKNWHTKVVLEHLLENDCNYEPMTNYKEEPEQIPFCELNLAYDTVLGPETDRDKHIWVEHKLGKTYRKIGKELGLSRERIHQIFKKENKKIKKLVNELV